MARGHGNDQAFAFARDNSVKLVRNDTVVLPDNHLGPNVLAKINKVASGTFVRFKELEPQLQA
jgi:hypothetical protein